MVDRVSCERRVYRLATLLTGDPKAATRVITTVVGAQPDLRRLDSAHLDRLTVLRSREIKPGKLHHPLIPDEVAAALAALTRQQREAWIFHYVYRMMPRDIARAMDCSVRAVQLHMTSAEGAMNDALGRRSRGPATKSSQRPLDSLNVKDRRFSSGVQSAPEIGRTLLHYTMQLDVPDFYRAAIRTRRMCRLALRITLAVLAAGAIIAAAVIIFGA